MALIVPYLPLNPLLPRPKGGKDAEGMKKQIPSNWTSFRSFYIFIYGEIFSLFRLSFTRIAKCMQFTVNIVFRIMK